MQYTPETLKKTAHIAGVLFFLTALATAFSVLYVRSALVDFNNPAATAHNILSNEFLFRSGIVVNILCQVLHLFLGLMLYRLFAGVDRVWAMALFSSKIISLTIAMVFMIGNLGALVVLSNADYLRVFTQEQLQSLMMLFLKVGNEGQGLLEVFWCPANFALGLLIVKSRYIPRIIGILLMIGSFAFPINVAIHQLFPLYKNPLLFTTTVFMGAIGGIPAMLWLMIRGADISANTDGSKAS